MESVLNIANIHLVAFTFLFSSLRINELAVANTMALMFLNGNAERKETYIFSLFMNGFLTFVMGYPYFFASKQNHGVYLMLLGSFMMMYAAFLHSQQILQHYMENFQAQEETVEDSEEEKPAVAQKESETETETEEDYSDMPPLIPVRRTDSISDYPAFAEALRTEPLKRPPPIEIPPLDVADMMENTEKHAPRAAAAVKED